jgi:hypothetical protein
MRREGNCTNPFELVSEVESHSDFHWVACILDQATRRYVANVIEVENGEWLRPREEHPRADGRKEDERDGGEESEEHLTWPTSTILANNAIFRNSK